MPPELETGLVAAGAALLGGAISGFATYRAALIGFRIKRTRAKLRAALEDVEFLRELEGAYLARLTNTQHVAAQTLQHELRVSIHSKLGRDLHKNLEPARVRAMLQSMSEDPQ